MSLVLITDTIEDPTIEREILGDRLTLNKHSCISVLLVWHARIDADQINRFPNLKAIIRYGVGFDNVDVDYAAKLGIPVCNCPDYCTREVAMSTVAMILNFARGITIYDGSARAHYEKWQENVLTHLRRPEYLKVGIIGAGRIGSRVIRYLKDLDFPCIYYDKYLPESDREEVGVVRTHDIKRLLECSDFVTLHVPLTSETKGMINSHFIEMMKVGSHLINTSRGELVEDLDDIYFNLRGGKLAGVFFDVLPEEPPAANRLIDAWRRKERWMLGRLVISPHAAFYTRDSLFEMRKRAALNALRVCEDHRPLNIVNGV